LASVDFTDLFVALSVDLSLAVAARPNCVTMSSVGLLSLRRLPATLRGSSSSPSLRASGDKLSTTNGTWQLLKLRKLPFSGQIGFSPRSFHVGRVALASEKDDDDEDSLDDLFDFLKGLYRR
jgi:hypothetical protein